MNIRISVECLVLEDLIQREADDRRRDQIVRLHLQAVQAAAEIRPVSMADLAAMAHSAAQMDFGNEVLNRALAREAEKIVAAGLPDCIAAQVIGDG